MSVSKWAYEPEKCDGMPCAGDCDLCEYAEPWEDEEDYIVENPYKFDERRNSMRGFPAPNPYKHVGKWNIVDELRGKYE